MRSASFVKLCSTPNFLPIWLTISLADNSLNLVNISAGDNPEDSLFAALLLYLYPGMPV